VNAERISPELVLVDPELRARVAELPTGPFVPRPSPLVEAPGERAGGEASVRRRRLGSIAYVCALVLALPALAIAADLVRSGGPRFAPQAPVARSRRVHVPVQQHVLAHGPRGQTMQAHRAR
jgi:hypothetical protein